MRCSAVPCTRPHARREPSGSVVARADPARDRARRRVLAGRACEPARDGRVSPPPSSPASGRPRDGGPCARRSAAGHGCAARPRPCSLAYHRPPLDRPRELRAYVVVVLERMSPRPRMPPRVLREPIFHPGDGPRALAGAADRHGRRPGRVARARGRRAGVVRRRARARARGRRRAPAPLPLRAPAAQDRPAAGDRAPEAAAEGAAAASPARAAGLDPGPRRRARLRPRALGGLARLAAHRAPRGRPARPRGLLRRRDRRARVRDLPHRGLSRVGRARVDGALHQRRPGGRVGLRATTGSRAASPRRTCRRARRPPRRWPTSRPSGSTAG